MRDLQSRQMHFPKFMTASRGAQGYGNPPLLRTCSLRYQKHLRRKANIILAFMFCSLLLTLQIGIGIGLIHGGE